MQVDLCPVAIRNGFLLRSPFPLFWAFPVFVMLNVTKTFEEKHKKNVVSPSNTKPNLVCVNCFLTLYPVTSHSATAFRLKKGEVGGYVFNQSVACDRCTPQMLSNIIHTYISC